MTLTKEEMAVARRVARRSASQWVSVERDDIEQHLMLWMLENARHLDRWRFEPGDGKLYVALRREAGRFCAKETGHAVKADLDDGNRYTVRVVERVLPFLWEMDGIDRAPGGEAAAVLADLSGSYFGMAKADQDVIAWRYRDQLTYADLGSRLDVGEDGARKRVKRAVERLTGRLGGEPAFWENKGSRFTDIGENITHYR